MEISNNMDYEGLNIQVFENVFSSPRDIFEELEKEIQYLPSEKSFIYIKGKIYNIPRRIAAYGYPGVSYTFSGLHLRAEPWIPALVKIKDRVEELCGCSFNFVLINRYKDGQDSIGQHKDNENDLSDDYPIVTVSLGETRTIVYKRQNLKDFCVELEDNSMLVMRAPTNKLWTHGIPRQSERKGVRLSLTFRKISRSKRKLGDDESSGGENKKAKNEYVNSQSRGFFSLEDIPEGIYPVGENIFLSRNVYRRKSAIHIRRYKQYGQLFYPTKEGITMDVHEFDILLKTPIPHQLGALFQLDDDLGFSLDISALEGESFKLTKHYDRPNGQETTTSLIFTVGQWKKMKEYHDSIMELLIDDLMSKVAFKDMFLGWSKVCRFEGELQKSLPESWDVTVGTRHVTNIVKTVIMDLLVDLGLIMPEYGIGEVISSNDIKDFNSVVKDLNMNSVMQIFYEKVTKQNVSEQFLLRRVVDYITIDFLNSIDFPYLISEVRRNMCPTVGMTSIYVYFLMLIKQCLVP